MLLKYIFSGLYFNTLPKTTSTELSTMQLRFVKVKSAGALRERRLVSYPS